MTTETRTLSTRLRSTREARGVTMEDAAQQLGVSLQTLWRWEHAKVTPNRLGLRACEKWLARPTPATSAQET